MDDRDERDVVEKLGPPTDITGPEGRMLRRGWKCDECQEVTISPQPIPRPAPCSNAVASPSGWCGWSRIDGQTCGKCARRNVINYTVEPEAACTTVVLNRRRNICPACFDAEAEDAASGVRSQS